MDGSVSLSIGPDLRTSLAAARAWRSREAMVLGRPLSEWKRSTRDALGLPGDSLVVMTGHQAQIWHAGILAKWFVSDACATALNGTAAQLVVDQDVNDAGIVSYPAERNDRLVDAILPTIPPRRAGPTSLQATLQPGTVQLAPVPEASAGIAIAAEALQTAFDAPNAAAQLARTNDAMLRPYIAAMPTVFASNLLATPLGDALLSTMSRDPLRCIDAYNAALLTDPYVARALDRDRFELPLWKLRNDGRDRIFRWPDATLSVGAAYAPRAFLMTAFARLALCDLFVHGTGGKRYEQVTEGWIRNWLGVELAPMVSATATLRLPLDRYVSDLPVATLTDLRRLRADPDADATTPSSGKRTWLERIAALPRRVPERRAQYRAMLAYLDERRVVHASQIDHLANLVATSADRAATSQIAQNREWPWVLHRADRLVALRDAVREVV